jgi:hypothetical protein
LSPGIFYRFESVVAHLIFREHNPLNLGQRPDDVTVFVANQPTRATRLVRERLAATLVRDFVLQRLIPYGCVRAAVDEDGKFLIAREPYYDALFGRPVAIKPHVRTADAEAKVIVQPDFSVIVIGLNPGPTAALAPFCVRTNRGAGQGAAVMKITRDSVVKAVSNGMKPTDIVGRLKQHASNEIPANVLKEVGDWASWVRRVTPTTITALRCQDREAADRVMAVLKRRAERVNDTLVAIDEEKLTSTDRNKLLAQGILLVENSRPAD